MLRFLRCWLSHRRSPAHRRLREYLTIRVQDKNVKQVDCLRQSTCLFRSVYFLSEILSGCFSCCCLAAFSSKLERPFLVSANVSPSAAPLVPSPFFVPPLPNLCSNSILPPNSPVTSLYERLATFQIVSAATRVLKSPLVTTSPPLVYHLSLYLSQLLT